MCIFIIIYVPILVITHSKAILIKFNILYKSRIVYSYPTRTTYWRVWRTYYLWTLSMYLGWVFNWEWDIFVIKTNYSRRNSHNATMPVIATATAIDIPGSDVRCAQLDLGLTLPRLPKNPGSATDCTADISSWKSELLELSDDNDIVIEWHGLEWGFKEEFVVFSSLFFAYP